MNKRLLWSRVLCIVGTGMIITAPAALFLLYRHYAFSDESGIYWFSRLMQVPLLLPVFGSGLVALGAFLGKSHYRRLLYAAFPLTICGLIAALRILAAAFNSYDLGPGPLWALYAVCAYPIGAIMSCVGAVLAIIESFHRPPIPQDNAHVT